MIAAPKRLLCWRALSHNCAARIRRDAQQQRPVLFAPNKRYLLTDASVGLDHFDDFCRRHAALLQHSDTSLLNGRISAYLTDGRSAGDEQSRALQEASSDSDADAAQVPMASPKFIIGRDLRDALVLTASNPSSKVDFGASEMVELFSAYCAQSDSWHGLAAFEPGPSMLRWLHRHSRCDDAFSLMTQRWSHHVDHLVCYQLCMDLLFEHAQHDRVLQVWDAFCQHSTIRQQTEYPKTLALLVFASCYQQATAESLQTALNLLTSCSKSQSTLPARSIVYVAALAAKLGEERLAVEVLDLLGSQVCSTMVSRSLHVQLLARTGYVQEAINVLSDLVLADLPIYQHAGRHIAQEAVTELQTAVDQLGNESLSGKVSALVQLLRDGGHLSGLSTAEMLTLPIATAVDSRELMLEELPETAEDRALRMLPFDEDALPPRPLISTGAPAPRTDQEVHLSEHESSVQDPEAQSLKQAHKQAVLRRVTQRRKSHGPLPREQPPDIDYEGRVKQ